MLQLNARQKAAAEFKNGVASVVAIPGSGKTITMTHRIGHLVRSGVSPESILGLTFTRNAAQAMRDKLKPILSDQSSRVMLATIHSFCRKLLQDEGKVFEILNGSEQIRFMRNVIRELRIKNISTGTAIREIGLAKNNLITADEFPALYENDETMMLLSQVYCQYELLKKKNMMLDFNDLLLEACQLLRENMEIREKYQRIYPHILVDEFQDTNPAQMELLIFLAGNVFRKESSLWICGDDWQSIYAFTGATVSNILNFNRIYENSSRFILDINYRSTPQILRACQNLISHNIKRIDKTLNTDNKNGEEVIVLEASNEEEEARQIVNEIKDLLARGHELKDMAILYRANSQSRVIEETLVAHEIPYRIENGMNFYQRHEVKVLLDYLRLIDNPDSDDGDDALVSVINTPSRYIGRKFITELEDFAAQRKCRLYEALKTMPIELVYLRKHIKDFKGLMNSLMEYKSQMSPAEMIQALRAGLNYDRFITDDDIPSPDDSKIANINQLQLAAVKFDNIESLLNYTRTFKDEKTDDRNGVNLMTIHKSKGLEFTVVFVIGMVEGMLPNTNGDIEEERRVAFVGMSRAMRLLYLSYSRQYMGRNVKKSGFIDEMRGKS